jgi:hypothetical protein
LKRIAAALIAGLACAGAEDSPAPDTLALAAAIDSLDTPFTSPSWLQETQDGVLVIYDGTDAGLVRVNPTTRALEQVSRRGSGPLEYRTVHRVLRGPGDSIWVLHSGGSRAIVLDASGKPVRDVAGPLRETIGMFPSGGVRGITESGDWIAGIREAQFAPAFRVTDSADIVRATPLSGTQDTLARVAGIPVHVVNTGAPVTIEAFTPYDAWGPFRDGRVIVVRANSYRVEVYEPDGSLVHAGNGPTGSVPIPLARADAERERQRVIESRRNARVNPLAAQMGVSAADRPDPVLPDPLPSHWPLLRSNDIRVDRQERAWVHVRGTAEGQGASRYDLFDRDGRYLKSVAIAANEHLVGFDQAALWIARSDDDGLQWLRRHPLP